MFTYDTHREASFHVEKEPERSRFGIRGIKKGEHDRAANEFDGSGAAPVSDPYFNYTIHSYRIISVHTHPGEYGSIVPSFGFDAIGEPQGDLAGLRYWRLSVRDDFGYDARLTMGIEKSRTPSQFDLLLIQEKTEKPLEVSELLDIERAMKGYYESGRVRTPEENYQASQEVAEVLKGTGFYNAEIIRYRAGRPLKEDLGKLVTFEFDEINLSSRG